MSGRTLLGRREFLATGAVAGAGLWLGGSPQMLIRAFAQTTPTLDPLSVDKYVTPLVIPPPMPKFRTLRQAGQEIDYYEIAVRQFVQQVLPVTLPATTVWSYGSARHKNTFNYPAFTIEAKKDRPVRVKWINGLMDAQRNFLPHLLPVDQTLHWANPGGGEAGRDSRPTFTSTPGTYTGPVPIVTHVHGAHTGEESDGYPEAWFLPNAKNIPGGYAWVGSYWGEFKEKSEAKFKQPWWAGNSVFQYPNNQAPTTMWYHDHTLGLTRANVYAGPAGFYLLRDDEKCDPRKRRPSDDIGLPGPAPGQGTGPVHEIPLAIQDRSFNSDGSLFYPDSRAFFDGYTGPYIPDTDVPPIWNPEFFGNSMLVNGKTWPVLNVERKRYRFRLLNGCNSRFIIVQLTTDPTTRPSTPALPMWQIGAEGGFLAQPVQQEQILMSPAERADVIVDFSDVPEGTELYMVNLGPDEPFGGGVPGTDFAFADPNTTGQIMKFVVGPVGSRDKSTPPEQLVLPNQNPKLGNSSVTRQVSLNEMMSMDVPDTPVMAMLGTVDFSGPQPVGVPLMWDDPITEKVKRNSTETWEIYNFTVDAHPIHLHEVQFKVLNRQPFNGVTRPPEPHESGRKDTVIALPGEITRIKAKFDIPGRFVWHCHIVEHEDNEMMRPYKVF